MYNEEKTRDELLAELAILRKQVGLIMGWQANPDPSLDGVVRCDDTFFRALVESSPLGFYVYDPAAARVLFFNHRFCELWALTDLEMRLKSGELSHDVVSAACSRLALDPAAFAASCLKLQAQCGDSLHEDEIPLVDGRWIRRHSTALRVGSGEGSTVHACLFDDMTEWKTQMLAESLSDKMAALSQLTAGIAHDFNNLLTSVKGYATLAARATDPDTVLHRDLQAVIRSANLGANLTHRLLAFAHRQVITTRALDLNRLLAPMETALHTRLGANIELQLILAEGLGKVKIDAAQFEQAIYELVNNGRDAMPEGGQLIIETSAATVDENYVRSHRSAHIGRYIRVRVTDTGRGLSAEAKHHLFEPFFTTKGTGHGAGLGLPTVYGIVQQHRGHIEVQSTAGHGTSVFMFFPRVKADTAEWPPIKKDKQEVTSTG